MGSVVISDLSIVEFGSDFQVYFLKMGVRSSGILKIRLRALKSFIELILHTRNKNLGIKGTHYFTFYNIITSMENKIAHFPLWFQFNF